MWIAMVRFPKPNEHGPMKELMAAITAAIHATPAKQQDIPLGKVKKRATEKPLLLS